MTDRITTTTPTFVRRVWFIAGCGIVAAIVYLSLVPAPPLPMSHGFDKVEHVLAYATLMLWFAQLYVRRRWPLLAIAWLSLGVALEYAQGLGGVRTFSYGDVAANAAGVLGGFALARAGIENAVARVERLVYGIAT